MQLFSWSPTTFHSVYNVHNCDLYVLKKDLQKPGISPYVLDVQNGDTPRSSVNVLVTLREKATVEETTTTLPTRTTTIMKKVFKMNDYLNIPPPRMNHIEIMKKKLVAQYPNDIPDGLDSIEAVTVLPFVTNKQKHNSSGDDPNHLDTYGRTSTSVRNREDDTKQQQQDYWNNSNNHKFHDETTGHDYSCIDVNPESSNRWPICDT
jgi:hypothetical protein